MPDIRELADRIVGTLNGDNIDANLVDILAPSVTFFHNYDAGPTSAEASIVAPHIQEAEPNLRACVRDLRNEDVRVLIADGAIVFSRTVTGTLRDGTPLRLPECMVISVENGRLARFDVYSDKAQTDTMIRALQEAVTEPA